MTDSSRTERLEKLSQQLPPALKTKVRLGDVKASDASRDVAEAKNPAKKVGRDGLMEPKYRAVSKGQFLENFYWAQARKQKGQRKSKMGGDFVF